MVIAGHPEHDILFIAKQVADAAGLKNGSNAIHSFVKLDGDRYYRLNEVSQYLVDVSKLVDAKGRKLQGSMVLMTEPQAYRLLLRGHAPQSEAFRKWVTEEVLPTIKGRSSATA